ncbi:MAG: SMC-Scp complex subunit ScpB [Candidatus Doudnabacteria bacterium]|nr:SMC-Scp complex subunit ScpB [Candidatus Doudnabacteria bacterium]
MNLKSILESILLVASRPVSLNELARVTQKTPDEIREALRELKAEKDQSGVVILENHGSYLMSTNPENSALVKEFLNAELREKLTDASLETLAIVAYKQPVSRAEIEAIRGVNSQYTLRLLMMRGLIERIQSQKDLRVGLYRTTHEFLQHLGLKDFKDLPDFEELTAKVKPPEGFSAAIPSPDEERVAEGQ